ncbi:MAG TPA: MMPL family transporter, partial [Pseudonocardiaceae bacterium]|nr:MMPL family transporter [Pseudonocardiaceae bacterium]
MTEFVLRHKLLVFAFWILAAVIGVATLASTTSRLSTDFALPGQPGYVTDQTIATLYHNGGGQPPTVLTVTAPPGQRADATTADRVFTAAANAVPGTRIADQANTGDAHFVTADGRTGFALVFTAPGGGFGADTVTPRLTAAATRAAPPGWATEWTGLAQLSVGNSTSKGTSTLVETMLGALGALAVLAFVFGSLLALLPLLMALVTIPATFLMIGGLTYLTPVSMLVEFLVALIGLGVAIDYSLIVVVRWREERAHGYEGDVAI